MAIRYLAGAASTIPGGEARDVSAASRRIADSALLGARGNSGAILAQFFQGLAEGLEGCGRVTLARFATAALRAADAARSALGRPQEGTILTVMSDWARQLEVAGVVDAGAQGFVHLLEGVQAFLETRRARWRELVAETVGGNVAEVLVQEVGPVLGTHGGPGATAVAVGGALAPASAPAEAA